MDTAAMQSDDTDSQRTLADVNIQGQSRPHQLHFKRTDGVQRRCQGRSIARCSTIIFQNATRSPQLNQCKEALQHSPCVRCACTRNRKSTRLANYAASLCNNRRGGGTLQPPISQLHSHCIVTAACKVMRISIVYFITCHSWEGERRCTASCNPHANTFFISALSLRQYSTEFIA